jgi:hypothetical protein
VRGYVRKGSRELDDKQLAAGQKCRIMGKPSSRRLELSSFSSRQRKGYEMGSSKRVSLAVMLMAMVASSSLLAAGKGKRLYDLRYADQRKKVDGTTGKADDVALAKQHLKEIEEYSGSPELVKMLLEQAYELGIRDATGYATAAAAVDLLIAKFPDEKTGYVDEAVRVYELQVRRNQNKATAGGKLIAILLEQAAEKAGNDDFGKSVDLASKANSIAVIVKSPRKAEVSAVWKYYRSRRDLKATPSNNALRTLVIRMCVTELDDPAEGAELLTGDMSEQLQTYAPLAAKDPAEVAEAACLELGNWYVELAKDASTNGKVICLDRAITYLERFLDLHKAEDTSRTQGKLLLDKTHAERKKLQPVMKPTPNLGGGIDLLKLVDVERDRVSGRWKREGDFLRGNAYGKGDKRVGSPRLMLPVAPQGSYELNVTFVRKGGLSTVRAILPVGQGAVAVGINGGKEYGCGLTLVDGEIASRNGTFVRHAQLAGGREYALEIRVLLAGNEAEISASLDRKELIRWKGRQSSLSVSDASRLPDPKCIGLGSYSQVIFKEVKLRMISSEAKVVK